MSLARMMQLEGKQSMEQERSVFLRESFPNASSVEVTTVKLDDFVQEEEGKLAIKKLLSVKPKDWK